MNDYFALNIKNSQAARLELSKGIVTGISPFMLLLIAIKCISDMSGDTAFYVQCLKNINAVYGAGLQDDSLRSFDIKEYSKRIEQITESLCNCSDKDTRQRLEFSIRLQQNEIKSNSNRAG